MTELPDWARGLDLSPHPEGGWFRETWRSDLTFPQSALPPDYTGPRQAGTAILFLLMPGQQSAWHTVRSAELWLVHRGSPLLLVEGMTGFWIFGAALGVFFGPVQAASRSLMARMAPPGLETEMFGLYALSGKVTAFAGPLIVGAVAASTGSQRWALATVLPFLVVGGLLLLTVREEGRERL